MLNRKEIAALRKELKEIRLEVSVTVGKTTGEQFIRLYFTDYKAGCPELWSQGKRIIEKHEK